MDNPLETAASARGSHNPAPQLAYTVLQAAANLGIGRTTIYALIQAGELTPVKIRRRTLIRHDDLVALIEREA